MTDLYQLPRSVEIGGVQYSFHPDFRDILEILGYLDDPALPEFIRWQVALALFYEEPVAEAHYQQAVAYLSEFLRCGAPDLPGPRLLDWQQDAMVIISDVNKAAGQELRSLPFVHWWTFLGYFRSMGEGQFSYVLGIREKLRQGKKLEPQEAEFYRTHRSQVQLKSPDTEEKRRLEAMLSAR